MACICPVCRGSFEAVTGRFNRAVKIGSPLYCGRACAGLARRLKNPPTEVERRANKANYDKDYREQNRERIRERRSSYFNRVYDPEEARIARAALMPKHVEYCRQPAYVVKKRAYDRKRRALEFGEFAESHLLLLDLLEAIRARSSKYEIYSANGTLNKSLQRKRELWTS